MRYSAGRKQETRRRILDAAAVVFRRRGFGAAGVDEVMAEAGLTAGGFYAHFPSKEALFAEAFAHVLREGRVVRGKEDEQLAGVEKIRSITAKYLSPTHRGMLADGCPMPPLLAELPRRTAAARQEFEQQLLEVAGLLGPHLAGPDGGNDDALAWLAVLVGGLSLARAVADETLADRILAACREHVEASFAAPAKADRRPAKPAARKPARGKGVRKQ